jgi:hypothetical protein
VASLQASSPLSSSAVSFSKSSRASSSGDLALGEPAHRKIPAMHLSESNTPIRSTIPRAGHANVDEHQA